MFVQLYVGGSGFFQPKFLTCLVKKLATLWCDAVHDDASMGKQIADHFRHDGFELTTMTTDEDSVGARQVVAVDSQKIANDRLNAWNTETTAVFIHEGCPFRTHLEGGYI